jgi:hypothetical protein
MLQTANKEFPHLEKVVFSKGWLQGFFLEAPRSSWPLVQNCAALIQQLVEEILAENFGWTNNTGQRGQLKKKVYQDLNFEDTCLPNLTPLDKIRTEIVPGGTNAMNGVQDGIKNFHLSDEVLRMGNYHRKKANQYKCEVLPRKRDFLPSSYTQTTATQLNTDPEDSTKEDLPENCLVEKLDGKWYSEPPRVDLNNQFYSYKRFAYSLNQCDNIENPPSGLAK